MFHLIFYLPLSLNYLGEIKSYSNEFMNQDEDKACNDSIYCISNIYSGKHFSSVPLVEILFKTFVHASPLETT